MAPEMVGVRRMLDGYGAGVDVFSMGVVFLQLFGLGECWDFSPELRWDHLALIHPVMLPIRRRLLAGLGSTAASLLALVRLSGSRLEDRSNADLFNRQMLEISPTERIHVDNLWDYVSEELYTEVCAEAQIRASNLYSPSLASTDPSLALADDWIPGPWHASDEPVGRCLEFRTLQEDSAHDAETSSSVLRFRRDEGGAQPTDLEYRAPGFLDV